MFIVSARTAQCNPSVTTREAVHVERIKKARSRSHCCCVKAVSVIYYMFVYLCLSYPACKAHDGYLRHLSVIFFSSHDFGKTFLII
jgi:hypothetical protein